MLRVEDVHVLRHKVLVEGLSRRQAAREMGISRNTVRRYLRLPEPLRVEREPRRKPVLERVQPRLDALLEEWSADDGEAAADGDEAAPPAARRGLRGRRDAGTGLPAGVAAPARRGLRAAGAPPGRRGAGRLLRGHRRAGRRAPQGLEVPDAADVLGPRLRPALRPPGPGRLPRRPRAGVRPLRRGARAHRLRQPQAGGAARAVPPAPAHRAL